MKNPRLRLGLVYVLLIFSVWIPCIILSAIVPPVHGSSTEIGVINPDTGNTNFKFHTNTTSRGDHFNVTVFVNDVADLYSFQVLMKYDPTTLNATNAWIPSDATSYVFHGKRTVGGLTAFYYNVTDDPSVPYPAYSILVADSLLGTAVPFDGGGLLAIFEFKIIREPDLGETFSCDFAIDNRDTYLLDSQRTEIKVTKTNGNFEYVGVEVSEPYLEVEPQLHEAKRLETFNISVRLHNIFSSQKLVNVTFTLSYDAILLNVTKITEGSFLAEIGGTTFNHVLRTGNITVVNLLTRPYTSFPEGTGEIATITFQGIYQDAKKHSCNLKLHDIQLLNSTMSPLPFSPGLTRHGSYKISPATSEITLNVPKEVVIGANVTINGTITPTKAGVEVTLYYKSVAAIHWNNLTTVKTDSSSHYSYTWSPSENLAGVQQIIFYASWSGDNSTLGAESKKLTSQVRIPTTIEFDPGTKVFLGENVTITGIFQGAHVNVTICYRRIDSDGVNWTVLATVKTDSKGGYRYTWTTPEVGKYEVKAAWEGGDITEKIEVVKSHIRDYLLYTLGGMQMILVIIFFYFRKS